MKHKLLSLLAILTIFFLVSVRTNAQPPESTEGYAFKMIKEHPATSVKNQYRSSTCWSFSVISMLESELIRKGKGDIDLSEMFTVRYVYDEKALKYVRLHGSLNFAGGGFGHDVLHVIDTYGIAPESVYNGLCMGEENHVHNEMDEVLKGNVEDVVKNKNKKLTPNWHGAFVSMLESYLGEVPERFEYEGKEYTPESFARSLGLNMEDYIEISSFSHHPFYKPFILEVPDNWAWGSAYNVPLDELVEIMYSAVDRGYTVAWSSDISEKGFSWSNGVAIVPDVELEDQTGTEREKWEELTDTEKQNMMYSFQGPIPEKTVTQEFRQTGFDNYTTTDDHGMHITGIAEDQLGNKYFLVKNSWGEEGSPYDGYLYASESFVRYKTIAIMVNKNSIPEHILKKLNL
ncbi:MAG: aminopeptidase [Bacteroidales bacterium]|nr:aminopeptidase [Bacteroidales bacterium]